MKPSTSTVSFSPFERLLLKRLRPHESASLLLLVWIVVHKTQPLEADWHYLRRLARDTHQDVDIDLLIETVRDRRLDDLRLAAEILGAAGDRERHAPFLRKAIGLAASTGPIDAPAYHLLGFLADLCHTPPAALARLYREVTGQALVPPADPSRHTEADRYEERESAKARTDEGETRGNGSDEATSPTGARGDAALYYRRRVLNAWRRQTSARWRLRQWRRIRLARRAHEHRARQRAEREWAERQQRQRRERAQWQEQTRRERTQQQEQQQRREGQSSSDTYVGWRKRLALQVLELDERATPVEIKQAYRRLAQRHHPDRHQGLGERRIALASQRFQRIKDAYEYLTQHA